MSLVMARWVLFISLLFILPLPFYAQQLAWLPVVYLLKLWLVNLHLNSADIISSFVMLVMLELTLAVFACWWLAKCYEFVSVNWPIKIRGSIVGLTVFSLLLVCSSVPVYRIFAAAEVKVEPVAFRELYQ